MTTRRALLWTAASAARVAGANERVRLALIGCGGRGRFVAKQITTAAPDVEYVAACDVQDPLAAAARDWAGPSATAYRDFRKVLERPDIDAVHIATPDHWHALITVMACAAGKHVYVEKPLSHNVREGRAMVAAARRHGRIVHAGLQHRSAEHYAEVQEMVQGGQIGAVKFVRVWNNFNMSPDGIGRAPDSEPPAGVDWDLYLGPAPLRPYNPKRIGPTFRWFWDYANGVIADFGIHRLDTVHQVMGVNAPQSIASSGGRYVLKDMGEMPDVQQVTFEYPGFVLSYESSCINAHGLGGRTSGMRYYNAKGDTDRPHGEAYYGTKGTIFADRIGYEVYPEGDRTEPRRRQAVDATPVHARRFIDSIRGLAITNADVEIGHRSTTVALLGNIALKTGRKLRWDAAREEFTGDAEANRMLARDARKPWDLI